MPCRAPGAGGYHYAVCLREDNRPIGYVNLGTGGAYDLGYGLLEEFWHRGIMTEACRAVVRRAAQDGIPYVTATHDRQNPLSGRVMVRLGMRYCYSYEEQWQPKDFPVVFRLYQLNLDGQAGRVYEGYRQAEGARWFVEQNVPTAQGSLL